MSNILSVGDILEISCETGIGYASYAGKHSWLGDAIWIVPELFKAPRSDWSTVFGELGFFTFYAAHTALRHKLVRKVGYAIEAMRPVPAFVRTAVNKGQNGLVLSWLITDGVARTPRKDTEMSAEERLLPIGAIWNHKLLCERLEAQWTP
jgi:hypothetical protein